MLNFSRRAKRSEQANRRLTRWKQSRSLRLGSGLLRLTISISFVNMLLAWGISGRLRSSNAVEGKDDGQASTQSQNTMSAFHDPTYLRDHPLPFTFLPDGSNASVCEKRPGRGEEGFYGMAGLRKITIMQEPIQPTKVLCIIYTYSLRHDVVRAVAETYGQRCDGFLAASNATDPQIGAFDLTHRGREDYGNMWQKVRAIWQYVHDNYLEEYDFFHLGGDNMYVIAENLRYAASLMNRSVPIYMGAAMGDRSRPRRRFCGGGAGYTLNRLAVQKMVTEEFPMDRCKPSGTRPDEDRAIGRCLRLKVAKCHHNVDDLNETRYHHYDAQFHATWTRGHKSNWNWRELWQHNKIITFKEKLESISSTSVSFHLVQKSEFRDQGLRRYHALLYRLCNRRG